MRPQEQLHRRTLKIARRPGNAKAERISAAATILNEAKINAEAAPPPPPKRAVQLWRHIMPYLVVATCAAAALRRS